MKPIASALDLEHESRRFYVLDERYDVFDPEKAAADEDVRFFVSEGRKRGGPVLEIGCGPGRVLIPLARAGHPVTGVDSSPEMLIRARKNAAREPEDVRRRITIRKGDMRRFKLDQRFNLILIPFRGFLHMMTADDQKEALRNFHRHLADEGRLIISFFDPSPFRLAAAQRGETVPEDHGTYVHPATGRIVHVRGETAYDLAEQILRSRFVFEERGEDDKVIRTWEAMVCLRYIFRYEMEHLARICAFEVDQLYGGFCGAPWAAGREMVWVFKKKGV